MTWELASFLVLGGVLLAGFAWYERSRPPSQIVALVAAMAALAVAGRVALAPIPNVVATTDIVIFTGFAIGAAPGFAVGALAAVVSNFWLGQGPWTPWQMAAWGLIGILGAVLCRLMRGKPNRWVLAGACGLAGVAFGAIMNFSLMASYGGELTLERFLALEARAVPFDSAHAIGNITLAVIAGPAMVRMLVRFRERFEWRRVQTPGSSARPRPPRGAVAAGTTLLLVLVLAAPVRAADIPSATAWLKSAQNTDGGFPDTPGESSSVAMTGWSMLGLEASGINPLDVSKGGKNPVTYLRGNSGSISTTGDLARTTLALVAAGVDVRDFQGRNLLTELRNRQAKNGSWEGWPNSTAFAVMALRAGGTPAGLQVSLDWLRDVQGDDGGWGDVARSPSNADSTGAVLQVIAGSVSSSNGVTYLRRHQYIGGGYRLGTSGEVNSQSTAWALQGLTASGVDPENVRRGGDSPGDYLTARQDPDGHFRYSKSSNVTPVWVTAQVLVAINGKSFPLDPVERVQPGLSSGTATGTSDTTPSVPDYTSSLPGLQDYSDSYGSGTGSSSPPSSSSGSGSSDGNGQKNHSDTPASPSVGPIAPIGGGKGASEGEQQPSSTLAKGTPAAFTMADNGPAPLPPLAIGIGTGIIALVGTWFIGRRRVW